MNQSKYVVGDLVRVRRDLQRSNAPGATVNGVMISLRGEEFLVESFDELGRVRWNPHSKACEYYWLDHWLELVSPAYPTKTTMEATPTTLREKFTLALTPEPMRTFRKLGLTNGDNILTDDGAKIFLTWLLEKHQDEFKAEVADKLAEEKK